MKLLLQNMKLSEIELRREINRFCSKFGADFSTYIPSQGGPAWEEVRYKYILATTSRTGTSYLSCVLRLIGLGNPLEYFNGGLPNTLHFEDAVLELIRLGTSENGCLGIKLSIFDLIPFLECQNFPFRFEDCKWVFVTRPDMAAQAVSLQFALQTGNWDSEYSTGSPSVDDLKIGAIHDHIMRIAEDNRRWEVFFTAYGLKPLRITYDQIADDVLEVAGNVRKHCGITQEELFPQIKLRKQANELNHSMRTKVIASLQAYEGET